MNVHLAQLQAKNVFEEIGEQVAERVEDRLQQIEQETGEGDEGVLGLS